MKHELFVNARFLFRNRWNHTLGSGVVCELTDKAVLILWEESGEKKWYLLEKGDRVMYFGDAEIIETLKSKS